MMIIVMMVLLSVSKTIHSKTVTDPDPEISFESLGLVNDDDVLRNEHFSYPTIIENPGYYNNECLIEQALCHAYLDCLADCDTLLPKWQENVPAHLQKPLINPCATMEMKCYGVTIHQLGHDLGLHRFAF
uniref:Uncharacterized protein n=1 Tax=Caenorhabditis japonica TaxID=281687 RepID=A0A8R1EFD9_CAEJA